MRVALLQMDIALGDPGVNVAAARRWLEEAAAAGAELAVLPELWTTGYALDRAAELVDQPAPLVPLFAAWAKELGISLIAGSILERRDDGIYNTLHAYDPEGNHLADYSKIHLFRLMNEEKHLAPGRRPVHFPVAGAEVGALICYDLRFPELSRRLCLGGAQILCCPAEWPHPRLAHWRTLAIARAIENQCYVLACNRVGSDGANQFCGHSLVVNPWGEVLAEGGESETILYADLDLNLVDQVRRRIPVFTDRVPELY